MLTVEAAVAASAFSVFHQNHSLITKWFVAKVEVSINIFVHLIE